MFERYLALSIGVAMIVGASIGAVFFAAAGLWLRVGIALFFVLFGAAGLWLLRLKRDQAAFVLLVLGSWLGATAGMLIGGGNLAVSTIIFPAILIFSAWINSGAVLILGVATLAVFGAATYLTHLELLPVQYPISTYQRLFVQMLVVCFSGAVGYAAARNMRSRLDRLTESERVLGTKVAEVGDAHERLQEINARLEREVAQRIIAESEIAKLNRSLEQRVAARTAELQSALNDVESFSYSVSHDLRAPLRSMAGFSALLREDLGGRLSPDQAHFLTQIEGSTRRMATLIDDLLTFSQTSRTEPRRIRIDMRAMVEKIVAEAAASATVKAQFHVGELPPADGDPALLYQLWQNLIENALKFSAHVNEPRIEIGGAVRKGRAEYWVRDNGAGFDMAYVNKLFGVFQRLHTVEEFEGTGIGLATVQRIVVRHGGSVSAEGAVNQGATIRFNLLLAS